MERSRTQVIFRYLPGSVFVHPDGFVAKSYWVDGERADARVNKSIFLAELDRQLRRWDDSQLKIPRPSTVAEEEFVVIEPKLVYWDVWPLVYSCTNPSCLRVRRFFEQRQAVEAADPERGLVCRCGGRMRQLRYYNAHACGRTTPMFVPECSSCHSRDDVYLQDTGSFETAAWRCRACGDRYIQGTRFSPCNCGRYTNDQGRAWMRAYPVRDQRTYYTQTFTVVNLQSSVYDRLQRRPDRGLVALASYLEDQTRVSFAIDELESGGASEERMTSEAWTEREQQLRSAGLSDAEIDGVRARVGPVDEGVAGLTNLDPAIIELGGERTLLERAMLFDEATTSLRSLSDARQDEEASGRPASAAALGDAESEAARLGIHDLGVTLSFPIALAAYGYTRTRKDPEGADLHGFAVRSKYGGKVPVFAATAETEAVLVTLSARDAIGWLVDRGTIAGPSPAEERDARLRVLDLFANEEAAADDLRVLTHSMCHAMIRALADGRTGFSEASLAEWVVPETLTFAVYVSSFQAHTLGALWTLLHHRALGWLEATSRAARRCDNDPLCHHREPRACERCMYLTFGCREFNSGLSRRVLGDYWRYTLSRAAPEIAAVAR